MNLLRRRFLGSSLIVLGSSLLEALATPLWRWPGTKRLEAATLPIPSTSNSPAASPVQFVDVAREAGLTVPNVWGGADQKNTSSKRRAADWLFSIMTMTAGSTSISRTEPASIPTGHQAK